MKLSANSVVGMPVLSLEAGRPSGKVYSILVDPNSKMAALIKIELRRGTKYLVTKDIREINSKYVVINSEADFSDADELVKFRDFIDKPILLFNYKVKTQSGRSLGKCKNFCFDNVTSELTNIYISGVFWQKIITLHHNINASDILSISPKLIVVRDATIKSQQQSKTALPAHSS